MIWVVFYRSYARPIFQARGIVSEGPGDPSRALCSAIQSLPAVRRHWRVHLQWRRQCPSGAGEGKAVDVTHSLTPGKGSSAPLGWAHPACWRPPGYWSVIYLCSNNMLKPKPAAEAELGGYCCRDRLPARHRIKQRLCPPGLGGAKQVRSSRPMSRKSVLLDPR